MPRINALEPVTLTLDAGTRDSMRLVGFSRSGLATWLMLPELDVLFDVGECPLEAVRLGHVLLTHAHGDHARCLPRHAALRGMVGNPRPAVYYLPMELLEPARDWLTASLRFEGKTRPRLPDLRGVNPDELELLAHRRDLSLRGFEVDHTVPSLGYTIHRYKRKLLPELLGTPGHELARRRKAGEVIDAPVHQPLVTFIGDHTARTLREVAHIWDSPVLIIEATFTADGDEAMAAARGHTHLCEVARVLSDGGAAIACSAIVLKHFSLRDEPEAIRAAVARHIPAAFRERVHLLI